jgi:hypothetical protein
MRVGECILFLLLFLTYVAQAQRFHKKTMYSPPALPAGHHENSGEAGGFKSADGKPLHFIDDQSTIQDKAKPSQG